MMEVHTGTPAGTAGHGSGPDKKAPGKRSKKPASMKDPNAPKRPRTGYFLYCQETWQKTRSENPGMSFSDIGRQVGSMWNMLPAEEKKRFFEEAEKDKERYLKEFADYQKTDGYKDFMESKARAMAERKGIALRQESKPPSEPSSTPTPAPPTVAKPTPLSSQQGFVPGTDIPIFSQQFLEHNREMESELRKQRHANIDLEEENALLSRHVENMKTAAKKLQSEIETQRTRNESLRKHLETLRTVLVNSFKETSLPGSGETPSLETVDSYIGKLQVLISQDRDQHGELVAKVKEVAKRLEEETQQEAGEKMEVDTTESGTVSQQH